jgi:hypothetical protein
VNDADYFEYLRGDAPFPGEVAATGYADPGRRRPPGRPGGADQPDYAPARVNGAPARLLANGRYRPEYPPDGRPARGYPYDSGPMPAYRPSHGRPAPGYPPAHGRPPRGYPAHDSGPMPAYRPSNGRQALEYPSVNGRPALEYRPSAGRPPRGYPAHDSGPMPVYRPAAAGHPRADGRRILGWLPFGQRLVLLPKGTPFDDPEEELREHRDVNGGWLRPAVFGAMDGLVTNSSLIAGIGGGGGSRGAIVLSGIAGLIAGAFSMATGEYISVTSQNELTQARVPGAQGADGTRGPVGVQGPAPHPGVGLRLRTRLQHRRRVRAPAPVQARRPRHQDGAR